MRWPVLLRGHVTDGVRAAAVALFALAGALGALTAEAEHPFDVERAAARQEFFQAVLISERMPQRIMTTSARLAVARSAWALGWVERAIREYETALRDSTLSPGLRARGLLSRGIIEFQERRLPLALHFAEKAAAAVPAGDSAGATIELLWGNVLEEMNEPARAESHYLKAIATAPSEDIAEARFHLARCRRRLGNSAGAEEMFQQIPINHPRAPEALRALGEIALDGGDGERALLWLSEGREKFPEEFLDSWVDYAMVHAQIVRGDINAAAALAGQAAVRYPQSDAWVVLLQAELESARWFDVRGRN